MYLVDDLFCLSQRFLMYTLKIFELGGVQKENFRHHADFKKNLTKLTDRPQENILEAEMIK